MTFRYSCSCLPFLEVLYFVSSCIIHERFCLSVFFSHFYWVLVGVQGVVKNYTSVVKGVLFYLLLAYFPLQSIYPIFQVYLVLKHVLLILCFIDGCPALCARSEGKPWNES